MKELIKFVVCLGVTIMLSFAAGKDSLKKEIIQNQKLGQFYVVGEGQFRLQCKAIELETITKDKGQ